MKIAINFLEFQFGGIQHMTAVYHARDVVKEYEFRMMAYKM